MLPPHKTRIVATIVTASDEPSVLVAMIRAGLHVARLNLSHGTFEEHADRIERLRAAAARWGWSWWRSVVPGSTTSASRPAVTTA